MAVYRTSQLGWNPASANINAQLINFLNNIAAHGDSLHLEGMFKFAVNLNTEVQWKNNFTLTAENGCGIDFIGTGVTPSDEFFVAGSNMVLDNVLFQASGAPETGYQGNNPGSPGVNYHSGTMWDMRSKSPTIRSCTFRHNVGAFLDLGGANCLDMRNTYMHRSKGSMGFGYGSTNLYMYQCVIDDALIDGIKTVNGTVSATSNSNWLIEDCVFQNSRDAIDLTGGLRDSIIRNCIFRNLNVCVIDAKFVVYGPSNGANATDLVNPANEQNVVCRDFVLENCHIIDTSSALVMTITNQDFMTYNYAFLEAVAPQYISMVNCEFERTSTRSSAKIRIMLDKAGHHCTSTGSIKRGWITGTDREIETVDFPDIVEQDGWNGHHNTVSTAQVITTQRPLEFSVPFVYGQGGIPPEDPEDPEEPVIPAAPVSAGPAISVNATTGVLTVARSRIPTLAAKEITARVTRGGETDTDPFLVTVD